jgi:hypothetical protein
LEFELTESTHRKDPRATLVAPFRPDSLYERRSRERRPLPLSRRDLLGHALGLAAWVAWPTLASAHPSHDANHRPPGNLDHLSRKRLTESEFVYVSPLRSNGDESTCHGEVWYAWLDESVVLITAKTTWKARALADGLDSARVWVGDHGRWKGWFRKNEAFRQAPNFLANAKTDNDPALLDRLMNVYERKYPAEFSDWEDRQRSGFQSGERIIIRYSHL